MGDESANSSPHHSSAIGGCELTYLSAKSFPRQAGRQAPSAKRQSPRAPDEEKPRIPPGLSACLTRTALSLCRSGLPPRAQDAPP